MGPGALPVNLIPRETWQIPILIGVHDDNIRRGRLVLYSLSMDPPDWVKQDPDPAIRLDIDHDGVRLIGAELEGSPVESGDHVHITLYWLLDRPQPISISTFLDEQLLETHELGFGNLQRYHAQVASLLGETIIEQYALVVPSTIPAGEHVFEVQIVGAEQPVEVGSIEVVDQEEAMDRWLRIAD